MQLSHKGFASITGVLASEEYTFATALALPLFSLFPILANHPVQSDLELISVCVEFTLLSLQMLESETFFLQTGHLSFKILELITHYLLHLAVYLGLNVICRLLGAFCYFAKAVTQELHHGLGGAALIKPTCPSPPSGVESTPILIASRNRSNLRVSSL